jgi:rhodanese-related sulfurtransferase/DNA-binding transcriptional ArsR family regulator
MPGPGEVHVDVHEGVARLGRALASGTRLRLLQLLGQRERPVTEIAATARLNVTTTSAHLQLLREGGLVESRRAGRQVLYRIPGPDVASLLGELYSVAEARRPSVRADLAAVQPMDGMELMGRGELLQASATGRVVVLDVRPTDEYAAGHLHGAISIPLAELPARLREIPSDTAVVAYCRGRHCVLAHRAVQLLMDHGVEAHLAAEGIMEWLADGLTLETQEAEA